MADILLVEDDEHFRKAIVNSIEALNHKIIEAPNGRSARDILAIQHFDVIISDIQMPHFDGVELLDWVNDNCPTPFVMMTGFSHLLKTKSAHELGVQEFLTKPFRHEELIEALNRILKPCVKDHGSGGKKNEPCKVVPEYCKVSIDEFVAKPKIDYDVLVKLSDDKFVKVGHAGSELPRDQVERYRSNGVKYLYIKREDFSKVVEFNLHVSKIVNSNSSIPKEKKVNFLKHTGEIILEKAFAEGVDRETFDDAKELLTMTVSAVSESDEHFSLVEMLNSHCERAYAIAVGCAIFTTMIARNLGFSSHQTYFKLSMAALFQDVGMKEIEKSILKKQRALLSFEERKQYESHPVRGRDILFDLKGVPEDVLLLVAEHHEDSSGQGFPRRLSKVQQHPLSKILQLANIFVDLIIDKPERPRMKVNDALKYINQTHKEAIDLKTLAALNKIFN